MQMRTGGWHGCNPRQPRHPGGCRHVGNTETRMARPVGGVVHQSEAIDPILCKHCTSRWPSQATHGMAMELPIAL